MLAMLAVTRKVKSAAILFLIKNDLPQQLSPSGVDVRCRLLSPTSCPPPLELESQLGFLMVFVLVVLEKVQKSNFPWRKFVVVLSHKIHQYMRFWKRLTKAHLGRSTQ